jgi:hypothetical protein
MPIFQIFELIKIATNLATALHKDSAGAEALVGDVETALASIKAAFEKAKGDAPAQA